MKKKIYRILSLAWVWGCVCMLRAQSVLAAPAAAGNADTDYAVGAAGYSTLKTELAPFLSILYTLCDSIGGIIMLWGSFELGLSFQSHDGTSMPAAIKRIVAGAILTSAPIFINYIL